jgi:hypothetical protein
MRTSLYKLCSTQCCQKRRAVLSKSRETTVFPARPVYCVHCYTFIIATVPLGIYSPYPVSLYPICFADRYRRVPYVLFFVLVAYGENMVFTDFL